MNRRWLPLSVLASWAVSTALLAGQVIADEPREEGGKSQGRSTDNRGVAACDYWTRSCVRLPSHCGCCPDDYCRKPLPRVCCPPCGACPDVYCRKPLPTVPCVAPGCCEECYRVKPLPPVYCPCEPWYTCGASK